MNLNQDRVPATLDEAVQLLIEALSVDDVREVKNPNNDYITAHFTWGQMIRNEWSLWEKDTILVKWFKQNYCVEHADDISGLILDSMWQDVNNRPRRVGDLVKKFWKGTESEG